jgi:hypothetical protein
MDKKIEDVGGDVGVFSHLERRIRDGRVVKWGNRWGL